MHAACAYRLGVLGTGCRRFLRIPLHQHGELTGTQQIDCTCTVRNRLQRDAVTELNHTAAPLFKRNSMYAAVIGFCNFIRTGTVRNLIVL